MNAGQTMVVVEEFGPCAGPGAFLWNWSCIGRILTDECTVLSISSDHCVESVIYWGIFLIFGWLFLLIYFVGGVYLNLCVEASLLNQRLSRI